MSDQEQPETPSPSGADAQSGEERSGEEVATASTSRGRRRLLQGLVSASPGILTITGRPAWANACTHSGNQSGNHSGADEEPCAGEGCSPGFWATHTHLWHEEFGPNRMFYEVFGVDAFPNLSLFQVISQTDTSGLGGFASRCGLAEKRSANAQELLQALGFQTVAALQNAANGVRYELTVADVQRTFQVAFESCSLEHIETTKDSLDQLNNRYCPLPWG